MLKNEISKHNVSNKIVSVFCIWNTQLAVEPTSNYHSFTVRYSDSALTLVRINDNKNKIIY